MGDSREMPVVIWDRKSKAKRLRDSNKLSDLKEMRYNRTQS